MSSADRDFIREMQALGQRVIVDIRTVQVRVSDSSVQADEISDIIQAAGEERASAERFRNAALWG